MSLKLRVFCDAKARVRRLGYFYVSYECTAICAVKQGGNADNCYSSLTENAFSVGDFIFFLSVWRYS